MRSDFKSLVLRLTLALSCGAPTGANAEERIAAVTIYNSTNVKLVYTSQWQLRDLRTPFRNILPPGLGDYFTWPDPKAPWLRIVYNDGLGNLSFELETNTGSPGSPGCRYEFRRATDGRIYIYKR
jgi:hypothetical protein